jgi:hypothetical protein
MLPDNLSGSYKRYKEDTNVFATWLSNTARVCGYKQDVAHKPSVTQATTNRQHPVGQAPSARLKGKARKEAKAAVSASKSTSTASASPTIKSAVGTREIIVQAALIADSKKPPIAVPVVIQGVLRRAIQARKRCTAWFQKAASEYKSPEQERSNAAHEHFITVLERASEILEPCFEHSKSHQTVPSQPKKTSSNATSTKPATYIRNLFESLDVEDANDHELDICVSEAITVVPKSLPTAPTKSQAVEVFELDIGTNADLQFIIFCFYEDLHAMEKFLKQTWQKSADGEIDLATAALTTNVALELIRNAEEDIKAHIPNFNHVGSSYDAITSIIHPVPPISLDIYESSAPLSSSPIEEFVYRSTFLSVFKSAATLHYQDGSAAVLSLASFNLMMGATPSQDGQLEENDMILSLFLLELGHKILISTGREVIEKARNIGHLEKLPSTATEYFPFEDELSKSLQSAMFTRRITVHAVFGASLLLEIHKILGTRTENAYEQLRKRGAEAQSAFGIPFKKTGSEWITTVRRNPCELSGDELIKIWRNQEAAAHALGVSFRIRCVVQHNNLVAGKQRNADFDELNAKKLQRPGHPSFLETLGIDVDRVNPSKDAEFFHKHNPIYCGMEILTILVGTEKAGVDLSNADYSVMSVAHLYNALQQKNLLQGRWHAMDKLINTHMKALFTGSLPTNTEQIIRRFFLCIKTPVASFATAGKGGIPNWGSILNNLGVILKPTDVSAHIERYLEGTDSAKKLLFNIQKELHHESSATKRGVSYLEMLTELRDAMPRSISQIELDLISLTRKCTKLLVTIREVEKAKLGIENVYHGTECAELWSKCNLATAMEILADGCLAFDTKSKKGLKQDSNAAKQKLTLDNSRLSIAAEVMQEFLAEANSRVEVEPFDVLAATKVPNLEAMAAKIPKCFQKIFSGIDGYLPK